MQVLERFLGTHGWRRFVRTETPGMAFLGGNDPIQPAIFSREVVPAAQLETEALAVAAKIAGFSLPVVLKIKESVNRAYESSLAEGLLFERREFHSTFALDDQKEGMRAFVEKRKPAFKHR